MVPCCYATLPISLLQDGCVRSRANFLLLFSGEEIMTSSLSMKRTTPATQKRVDNHTQSYPPLDYSFHNAQKLEGEVVLSFSPLFLNRMWYISWVDAVAMEPREALCGPKLVKEGDRFHSHGINLNHNMLTGPMETLPNFVRMTLLDPNALTTLDLSFNVFSEIPKVRSSSHSRADWSVSLFQAVTEFPSLKFFYFHKNTLSDPNEIYKLVPLTELKYLTLHGNPVEISVPYLRSLVLCLLPDLRSLNCSPVTKGDRKTSEVWGTMNRNLIPKSSNKAAKK